MGDFGIGKIFVIALVVIVICGMCFFAIADGIVELIKELFRTLAKEIMEALQNLWENIKEFFGKTTIKNGMIITEITKEKIEGLRQELEGKGIDTEQAGISEILLRKMLLAQAVTSSTQDTLCVAQIDETEILKGTGYSDLQSYLNTLDKEDSEEEWPIEDYEYDLYYLSDKFFYFKDEDNMMEQGKDKYYIGVMGEIEMLKEGGGSFSYISETEFVEAGNKYEAGEMTADDLLGYYTVSDSGQLTVYSIIGRIERDDYIFKRNATTIIERGYERETEDAVAVPVNIETNVDSSTYVLSIEFLMHMLDISSSPEYLEYFIDYALEQTKITVRGYAKKNIDVTYEKVTNNIPDGFIFELYDMVNGNDVGNDNMIAYKEIVFDRWYDMDTFTGSVVDLPDFEKIDYGTPTVDEFIEKYNENILIPYGDPEVTKEEFRQEVIDTYPEEDAKGQLTRQEVVWILVSASYMLDGLSEEEINNKAGIVYEYIKTGKETAVEPLHKYLLSAYDPGSGYSLGTITVAEGRTITNENISLTFTMENISTWYGDIKFNKPIKTTEYFIDAVECEESEYTDFGYGNLTGEPNGADYETTKIYIYDDMATEASIVTDGITVIGTNSNDIYDNILFAEGEINSQRLTLAGLGQISFDDGGTYNEKTGAGDGSDYVYAKYEKTNIKYYAPVTKWKNEELNISTNIPRVSLSRVNDFLGQWQNGTKEDGGKKTRDPRGDNLLFSSDGIKVRYNDIYSGTAVVGDLFENGAYMMFQLLESSESTKKLVNVFKYIMYVYTGTDYGVTEDSMLGFIFSTVPYGGADYIVNTEMCPSKYVLNADQLREIINKYDFSYMDNPTQAKNNLLNHVDDFVAIQDYKANGEELHVNAVFAIAVTMQESHCGTGWAGIAEDCKNWASISYWEGTLAPETYASGDYVWCDYEGELSDGDFSQPILDFARYITYFDGGGSCGYFTKGKYSVLEIVENYAASDEQHWGPLVVAKMTDMYESIGIQGATGGALKGVSGNWETVTFGDRTYVEYKQGEGDYANDTLACYPDTTIKKSGCAITSDAIIATGFGVTTNPGLVNKMGSNVHNSILTNLTGRIWNCNTFSKAAVIGQLRQGNPVMVKVNDKHPIFESSSTHYFTILSITEDGNSVYVSDPACHSIRRNGWLKTSEVLNYPDSFMSYTGVE